MKKKTTEKTAGGIAGKIAVSLLIAAMSLTIIFTMCPASGFAATVESISHTSASDSVTVSWSPAAESECDGYFVALLAAGADNPFTDSSLSSYYDENGALKDPEIIQLTSDETSHTFTGLPEMTDYRVYVTSYKNGTEGTEETEAADGVVDTDAVYADVSTEEVDFSTRTVTLKAYKYKSKKLYLTWNAVTNATGYKVYMKNGSRNFSLVKTISGNKPGYVASNISTKSGYQFKVIAMKDNVYSMWSNVVVAAKPSTPSLTASAKDVNGNTVFTLGWNNKGCSGYTIYMSAKKSKGYKPAATLWGSEKTTYTFTKPGCRGYYFKVIAFNYAGGGYWKSGYSARKYSRLADYYDYSDYFLLDVASQTLKHYKGHYLKNKGYVVTGDDRRARTRTPKGTFRVKSRQRNITLRPSDGSRWKVKYWVAFKGSSYGIHDAGWREKGSAGYVKGFGFDSNGKAIYKYNGSHGCVNCSTDFMKYIYGAAKRGSTRVIVR